MPADRVNSTLRGFFDPSWKKGYRMSMIECYEKLSAWLCCVPIGRASRAYLETHLDLLTSEIEQFLELFIDLHSDCPHERQWLRIMQGLLQDANTRGGTRRAVRDAYVNEFGGLILDLPLRLLEVEQHLAVIPSASWTDRSVAVRKMQLRDAIDYALADRQVAPAIVAELQYQLGSLFINKPARLSSALCQTATGYFEASLQVYTFKRYPLQHAKVSTALNEARKSFSSDVSASR
jgi:hypothetical protein